ncbi:uncharacterized protein LOC127797067 [Diospyros lotus]|uniref:uncharacterized protein LOC127797067 n=1 Tax=Diospyros lotus TaxID=55363 RepID=UPI00224F0605|nr:uncharacterized protein LOC127797067 [Diospyros lotus]
MAAAASGCPFNSFRYNTSLCACDPGYLYNATTKACELFRVSAAEWVVGSGVDYSISIIPESIFSFNSIRKFTQSQAIFLEATLVMLLSWLVFCFFVRFGRLRDGRSVWFRIRWWISRLDISFATRHWLDDQKVVVKRKTELGGTFSVASWILFIGLFSALLYQIISRRNVEVHNVRTTNAPDLASFMNDMEFNITTISNMSCSHLQGIGTVAIGNPGFIDYRVAALSTFANYSCQNTSKGPTVSLKCSNCQRIPDSAYISWQFVDLPSDPATAVGFQFNITAKNRASRKHLSFVSGILNNGSNSENEPITYRGPAPNILKFNLFPRVYRNFHDLKLIQPLFHEFVPGSYYSDINHLRSSLQSSDNGRINITFCVNFLSAYIVEIDNQNILGPVGFLADLGGLYCISIGIFFYLLVQCEYRFKKFRYEDSVMRRIRNQQKAQVHWDKLRKYVMYTYGAKLDDNSKSFRKETCCSSLMIESLHRNGMAHKQRKLSRMDSISFNRKANLPSEKKSAPEQVNTQSCVLKSISNREGMVSYPRGELGKDFAVKNETREHLVDMQEGGVLKPQTFPIPDNCLLPLPPSLEFKAGSEFNLSDVKKNLQSLYDYNVMLRERLVAAESMLQSLTHKSSTSGDSSSSIAK